MGDKVTNIFGSIIVLAIVTTVLLPGRQTPQVLSSLFNGFSGSIRAASGK